MSKAREVAENRMFHDETNTVALGAAPAVPALPKDGTAFEKVGPTLAPRSSNVSPLRSLPCRQGGAWCGGARTSVVVRTNSGD